MLNGSEIQVNNAVFVTWLRIAHARFRSVSHCILASGHDYKSLLYSSRSLCVTRVTPQYFSDFYMELSAKHNILHYISRLFCAPRHLEKPIRLADEDVSSLGRESVYLCKLGFCIGQAMCRVFVAPYRDLNLSDPRSWNINVKSFPVTFLLSLYHSVYNSDQNLKMQFSKVLVALMGSTIVSCYDAVFTVYPGSSMNLHLIWHDQANCCHKIVEAAALLSLPMLETKVTSTQIRGASKSVQLAVET